MTTVLDEFQPPAVPINLLYVADRFLPIKIRAFLDFAAPQLEANFRGQVGIGMTLRAHLREWGPKGTGSALVGPVSLVRDDSSRGRRSVRACQTSEGGLSISASVDVGSSPYLANQYPPEHGVTMRDINAAELRALQNEAAERLIQIA